MAQEPNANFFSLSNEHGTLKIRYYTSAPGPLVAGQSSTGPKLEYQGPEGQHDFTGSGGGIGSIDILEQSVLGEQVTVLLVPTVDAEAVHLTLFLPYINMAGKEKQHFHTIAIKATSYGMLPKEGARLTYEVFHLEGIAQHVMLPLAAHQ